LLQLWEEQRKTVVFVTHSMDEAVMLGDRVMLMTPRPGREGNDRCAVAEIALAASRKIRCVCRIKEYLWENLRAMQVGAS